MMLIDEHGRRKNTPLAYDPKLKEFKEYCDVFYAGIDFFLPLKR